jgi:ABC-type multidrug transport system fused ATPase/permease subunit
MHQDPAAMPGSPVPDRVPDRVPDDLVRRYGAQARRSVRYHKSRAYPVVQRTRQRVRRVPFRDADVWVVAITVFACGIIAMATVGAMIYAAYLWPQAALFIVAPVLVMFGASFVIAGRITRAQRGVPPERTIELP